LKKKYNLEARGIGRVIGSRGLHSAFSKLERSEINAKEFYEQFQKECQEDGIAISSLQAKEMLDTMGQAAFLPFPEMVAAIREIRRRGLKTCALTNNWFPENTSANTPATEFENMQTLSINNNSDQKDDNRQLKLFRLEDHFDAVVESRVAKINKPDPRIYQLAMKAVGVEYAECVFLDDLGPNLKTAAKLGMRTIKVTSPKQALGELEQIVGFPLVNITDSSDNNNVKLKEHRGSNRFASAHS